LAGGGELKKAGHAEDHASISTNNLVHLGCVKQRRKLDIMEERWLPKFHKRKVNIPRLTFAVYIKTSVFFLQFS
jgi:Zn-dependent M16 (insulinase) family peptidase